MNKLSFLIKVLDILLSFITFIIGLNIAISRYKILPYGIPEAIITIAISGAVIYGINKILLNKAKSIAEIPEKIENIPEGIELEKNDKKENYENIEDNKEVKENEQVQPEKVQTEAQKTDEVFEKEKKHKRILITDDSWKEFHMPDAEGHTISDYRQIGTSMFLDVTNWDAYTIYKEIEMFDPELKKDLYYKHKQEIFMKVNDRDYRYPKVGQSDMLKPEEIFQIEIESNTPIQGKNRIEIEKGKYENEENEENKEDDD